MAGDRMPPQAIDSEAAVLGAIMLSSMMVPDVLQLLTPDDFYKPAHQSVFSAIDGLWRHGQPIDAVTVADELTRADVFEDIGGPGLLLDLMSDTPASSRVMFYADNVVRASRLRRMMLRLSSIIDDCYEPGADPSAIFDSAVEVTNDPRVMERKVVLPAEYQTAKALAETVEGDDAARMGWLIPRILRPMWRVMIVGREGSGKSMLGRQIATCLSNGVHPFVGVSSRLTPRRCLIVDAENPLEAHQHQFGIINERAHDDAFSVSPNLWVWRVEGGIDFRTRVAQMQFESILQDCRPELVTMGPVYKLYRNGKSDMEQAATEFTMFLDGLRQRYNFALLMEHHAPKGNSEGRELVPFGTSAWLRWPEFGLVLKGQDFDERERPHRLLVKRFRGDRLDADWPTEFSRDAPMRTVPWEGVWPEGTWTRPVLTEPPPPEKGPFDDEDW